MVSPRYRAVHRPGNRRKRQTITWTTKFVDGVWYGLVFSSGELYFQTEGLPTKKEAKRAAVARASFIKTAFT